jgi:hypothetical protein
MIKHLAVLLLIGTGFHSIAQKKCVMQEYAEQQLVQDNTLKNRFNEIEVFTSEKISTSNETMQRTYRLPEIIKVPVVVHVLYHTADQNVSKQTIDLLLAALNRDFNKQNADTANIPSAFKPFATSMGFEFKLASVDARGTGTTGIIRKYTPITYWLSDDKMKFSASYGDDAWDSKSYLNIWICNMIDALGYSTFPGMDPSKDGVVMSYETMAVGYYGTTAAVNDFRTIVHEVGHWLNLRHLWGESYCGDDKVDDTPKQSTYTPGCPSGSRVSCNNSLPGDMYMNYMDFTNDVCMNMFTIGQRKRARALFEFGGARNSILSSKGLNIPDTEPAAVPDYYPRWLHVQVYPNPATTELKLFFEYDERWKGKKLQIFDITGRLVISKIISSQIETIDVSRLNPGTYFIDAWKEEEKLRAKFVKL